MTAKDDLDTAIEANKYWRGRPRECPQCSGTFVSQGDRGHCTHCQHIFYASHPDLGNKAWWVEDNRLKPITSYPVGPLAYLRLFPVAWWHLRWYPELHSVLLGKKGKYRVSVWKQRGCYSPKIGVPLLERAGHPLVLNTKASWHHFEILLQTIGMDSVNLKSLPELIKRFAPRNRTVLCSDDDSMLDDIRESLIWDDPIEQDDGFVFHCNDLARGKLERFHIDRDGKVTVNIVGEGIQIQAL